MAHFQVNNQSFPTRCEICHQADQFDPESNRCDRCAPLQAPKPRHWMEKMMFPVTQRDFWAWKLMLVTTGFVLIDSLVCYLYPLRAGVLGFLVYQLFGWDFPYSYYVATANEQMGFANVPVAFIFLFLTNGILSLYLFTVNVCSILDLWVYPYKRLHLINLIRNTRHQQSGKKFYIPRIWRIQVSFFAIGGILNLVTYGMFVFPAYTLGDTINCEYHPHIELKLLFNKSLHLNDQFGWTPLLYATAHGDQAMMHRLLQRGVSVDAPSSNGLTPLMIAAAFRNEELCDFLIDQGADTNRADSYGSTPIDFALQPILLVDVPDSIRASGFSIGSKFSFDRLDQTIAKLRQNGARISGHTARKGQSTAMLAAENGVLELVKTSVREDPAQINQPDMNGETLLMRAVAKQNIEMVRFLIDQGADVNARNRFHYAVVHFATPNGNIPEGENTALAIFQLLVQHGADLNAQDYLGETPLFEAAKRNYRILMKYLLDHGADPTIQNCKNHSIIDEVWLGGSNFNKTEVIRILENAIAARRK